MTSKTAVCGTKISWNSIPILEEVDDFKEVAGLRNQENTESVLERRRSFNDSEKTKFARAARNWVVRLFVNASPVTSRANIKVGAN